MLARLCPQSLTEVNDHREGGPLVLMISGGTDDLIEWSLRHLDLADECILLAQVHGQFSAVGTRYGHEGAGTRPREGIRDGASPGDRSADLPRDG